MTKEYVRKFSDYWGDFDCSSNKNNPKEFLWAPPNTDEFYNHTIYVDNYIKSHGLRNDDSNKLGWLLESPQMNESIINDIINNLDLYKSEYKYIFTCLERLLLLGEPFTYTISNAVPWILPENRRIYKKSKLISMIASNKGFLNGHKERLIWVDRLKNKVDLFGTGREFELKNKEDGLVDYMFTVAIENDYSDTYFTEKLTDAFATGTVPVYLGSRNVVEKYFDSRGVIFLEEDPDLETVNEKKYMEMLPYIEKNYDLAINLPIAEDYIYLKYLKK